MSQVSWSPLVRSGYATGTRGTAVEDCVRRAGMHMRAGAGIIGNGFRGCDRAIPNELRSLLPGLRNLRLLLLSHRHGLRSQVPLMDVLPNATQPDHPKVQDDLSACDGP